MTPDDIDIDDALMLRALIQLNEELVRYCEAQGRNAEAAISRSRLAACTKKLAEIEAAAEAAAKRGGSDNARFV